MDYIINTFYTFFKPFHRLINQNKRYFVLVSFALKDHRSTISPQFDNLKRRTQTFAQRFLSISERPLFQHSFAGVSNYLKIENILYKTFYKTHFYRFYRKYGLRE
jgi:hypothetical protein